MPKICYVKKKFSADVLKTIETANHIIAEYEAQGFELTLRQIYYQFVARDLIPNTEKSYKNLGSIISDARMAGLIDWNSITDRTRFLRQNSHWDSPSKIIESAAASYKIDLWERQEHRPEVWIEKDALVGVVEGVCRKLDVPYFSCRGYTSQSEMWAAAMRIARNAREQRPVIFHFGDHDPSGKDMTRDIIERIELFTGGTLNLQRLALNMNQIEEFKPPPNPAKISDPRAGAYIAEFGNESWELDALEPKVIVEIIEDAVTAFRDEKILKEDLRRMKKEKELLGKAAKNWDNVVKHLEGA